MILVVGLGNPGKKYESTRHNIGFQAINEFARKNHFPDFKLAKTNALISEGLLNREKIILAKPQTFMNNSGKAVKSLMNFYKITRPGLVVIHDDIDLPLGKIRIVRNRGAAGHKGVESIIKELGAKNFIRFRIGIQPKAGKPKNAEKFVLQKITKDEDKIIKRTIIKTALAVEVALMKGLEKAMNKYNK